MKSAVLACFALLGFLSALPAFASHEPIPAETEGPKKKLSLTPTDNPIDQPSCGACALCVDLLNADTLGLDFAVDEAVNSLQVRARIRQGNQTVWTSATLAAIPLSVPGKQFSVTLPLSLLGQGLNEGAAILELDYLGIAGDLTPDPGSLVANTWVLFQAAPVCLSYNCLINPRPKKCNCKPCNTFGIQGGFVAPGNSGGTAPRPFWGADLENKMVGLTYYRRKGKVHYQFEASVSRRAFTYTFDTLLTPTAPPRQVTDTFSLTQFQVSPLQFRLPVKRLFSVGAGVNVAYLQQAVRNGNTEVNGAGVLAGNYRRIEPGAFGDLRLGNPGKGLNVGLRYEVRYGGVRPENQVLPGAQYYVQYLF